MSSSESSHFFHKRLIFPRGMSLQALVSGPASVQNFSSFLSRWNYPLALNSFMYASMMNDATEKYGVSFAKFLSENAITRTIEHNSQEVYRWKQDAGIGFLHNEMAKKCQSSLIFRMQKSKARKLILLQDDGTFNDLGGTIVSIPASWNIKETIDALNDEHLSHKRIEHICDIITEDSNSEVPLDLGV